MDEGAPSREHTILVADASRSGKRTTNGPPAIAEILKDTLLLEDLGVKLRVLDQERGVALESDTAIISDALYADAVDAAAKSKLRAFPILSYLANGIRLGERDVPYSVVTAINAEEFEAMKRRPLIINTARGGLVDEADLVRALDAGLVSGAGFDVLDGEPPSSDNPLLRAASRHNVILTPHVAWASEEAQQSLADQLIDNIENFVGERPTNLVQVAD